ncbi:hypothetical protein [Nocardia arthritidis]|uniref:Mammalian cell entry protein n=1 Tax=Nocardia arthritidis TaxID=228602 RepID=A0A6G9YFN0_9NOCA|nr:hypothetical protein [Nocardia arthritidis]QIS11877.1 hypothetical protein F5544_20045 [Nocardia arthritidis]
MTRQISLRISTILTALAVTVLLATTVTFVTLWALARSELHDRDVRAADDRHAEQVAIDYAVGSSTIDYRDPKAWLTRLQANTTKELAAKFAATAPQLEQVITPLQWTSTAKPIRAVVASESGGVYRVDAFLDVASTSSQAPQGGRNTVAYDITVDRNQDWKITSVGGGLQGPLAGR